MSPCYRQPCVTIHFTWKQDWPTVSQLLAGDRKRISPVSSAPPLGKTLHHVSPATPHPLQEAARVHRPSQKIRPHRQVPQRLPQHEYFHLVAEFMWSAAALLPLFPIGLRIAASAPNFSTNFHNRNNPITPRQTLDPSALPHPRSNPPFSFEQSLQILIIFLTIHCDPAIILHVSLARYLPPQSLSPLPSLPCGL